MLRAVLDANVYVSALVRPEGPPGQIIERFLRSAAFEIVLSPAIVEEVLEALAYPKARRRPFREPSRLSGAPRQLIHEAAGMSSAPAGIDAMTAAGRVLAVAQRPGRSIMLATFARR